MEIIYLAVKTRVLGTISKHLKKMCESNSDFRRDDDRLGSVKVDHALEPRADMTICGTRISNGRPMF
jgi:hypothetical protein